MICVYIYIYTYIEREREREIDTSALQRVWQRSAGRAFALRRCGVAWPSGQDIPYVYIYIYIYIYVYINISRNSYVTLNNNHHTTTNNSGQDIPLSHFT